MLLAEVMHRIPVILGSQSPRRKELLASLDLSFEVLVREIEEVVPSHVLTRDAAEYIAVEKIKAFSDSEFYDHVIITADTVVVDNADRVLGKPKDAAEAREVLLALSGCAHIVYTGVAIAYRGEVKSFTSMTVVRFRSLEVAEIDYYLDKYKPYDKAGSYGIQEWIGRIGVVSIEGSFENVVGLPTSHLYKELKQMFIK
ncbi:MULTISPECIES: Maf family protein [Sphingobacterium]|uniref:Maf family protein n=1 Tax=Sphingobacterium TaxID=28453 RepID=UPI001969C5FA|nr:MULTISPECIES: Maf family nucleotide pyrophosphatase [unclassified Sphingobacterium]